MIESRWLLFVIAWALAAAIQTVLYLRQRQTRNATAVDVGWAGSLVAIAALYALLADGSTAHRVLIASMCGLENLRVARLVLGRLGGDEDERYRELRERWRARGGEQARFLVFFQAQALVAAILSVPVLLVAFDPGPRLGALAWAGAALWVVAAGLERAADRQLQRFRDDPGNSGRTLNTGLWRYSRHPNYFFQWLTWVAYAVVALEALYGWIGLIAPAIMLCLILFVTGVPPAEASSLRSRGDAYRRYQRETSVFVPWFPKEHGP